jgi:2-polyprenyl-3-methyl-5-hydroxy-6-metoxy-1,4-benzoquinol methylase
VLEVAPGPGFLAIELAKLGPYRIVGLDISETFVRIAADEAASLSARGWVCFT